MIDALDIRPISEDEIQHLLDWADAEGWNPGLEDGPAFYAADPEGFLVGHIDGKPVCGISTVRYGSQFGFIGLYICRPEFRGKGYGLQVWKHAMRFLDGRVIGLDAVPAQHANYQTHGFEPAHRNLRHAGISQVDTPMDARLAPLGHGLFASVEEYDRAFFPAERSEFLRRWTAPMLETRSGFAVIEDGAMKGYGVIRKCGSGYKIGPLFAETPQAADLLFRALAGQVKGQMVILDAPEPNTDAYDLADRYELSPEFETFRMYRGPAPQLPLAKTYGITTFELG